MNEHKKDRIANYKGEGSFLFFGDGKYSVDALQNNRKIAGVIFFMTKVEGISLKEKEKQVVSKKKVFGHGEVYTSNREVNAMLVLSSRKLRGSNPGSWNQPTGRGIFGWRC